MTLTHPALNITVTETDATKIADYISKGFVEQAAPQTNSTSGKRRITKEQAKAFSDANLSESFGLPSTLSSQPIGFTFQGKIISFIEQPKRNAKGVFPSTQIEYNGTRFCILFDERHDENMTLNCKLADSGLRADGTPVTRSGKTVEVIY